jgi:ABC-type multidrug transport system ATPase subunit
VSNRVAIIDHGHIITQGTPMELKEKTHSKTLEEAFLSLTGKTIRDEEVSGKDQMRMRHRIWTKR